MTSKKDRLRSGWYEPRTEVPTRVLDAEGIVVNLEYDEWSNYRDGWRSWHLDYKRIKYVPLHTFRLFEETITTRIAMNAKQKRLLKVRRARKDLSQKPWFVEVRP